MKTLLERLKPEARKQLDKKDKEHSGVLQTVKQILNEHNHPGTLTISNAVHVFIFCYNGDEPFTSKLYFALFNDQ